MPRSSASCKPSDNVAAQHMTASSSSHIHHQSLGPIGIFDSGYGGLTILDAIRKQLPQYDYLYLGDNARAPYGARSFDVVYEFTRQAVEHLFSRGCTLVILGCNTASAKALRTIQQHDLPRWGDPDRRVLGVIRPTVEAIGAITHSRHVGILATEGTIRSNSYTLEINKLYPDVTVTGQACPLWAALVEAGEADSPGTDYFVEKRVRQLMHRHHHPRLHPLPLVAQQPAPIRTRAGQHYSAGRLCVGIAGRLPAATPHHRTTLLTTGHRQLSHHRERRHLPTVGTAIPPV